MSMIRGAGFLAVSILSMVCCPSANAQTLVCSLGSSQGGYNGAYDLPATGLGLRPDRRERASKSARDAGRATPNAELVTPSAEPGTTLKPEPVGSDAGSAPAVRGTW